MGLRLRLKASFATSSSRVRTLVILTAMKKYGIILADNGSNWYISGETIRVVSYMEISCQVAPGTWQRLRVVDTRPPFPPPGCD